ncbi:MAG TPA: hypothetical protein DCE55_17755, partial [Planctomycetaceae bacterium]|nr:hypothetical protein [Planctomycetaceae bacterium]
MKPERKPKPELKEEQEADSLSSLLQALVEKLPIAPELRVPLVLVFLVVFVFAGVWYGLKDLNESRNAAAWQELFQVAVPPSSTLGDNSENYERLNEFIDEQKVAQSSLIYMVPMLSDNTNVIAWATVKSANLALAMGINSAYQADKNEAKKQLEAACKKYEEARGLIGPTSKQHLELHREAIYGLAKAYETRMAVAERNRDENHNAAVKYYEELKTLASESALADFATERLTQLNDEQTADDGFYSYLATYKPEVMDPVLPDAGPVTPPDATLTPESTPES